MDYNTLLFRDTANGYCAYHRPWDGDKGGSSTVYRHSLQGLIDDMNSPSTRKLFKDPFRPKAGVPVPDMGSNRNPLDFKPLTEAEVSEVVKALKG